MIRKARRALKAGNAQRTEMAEEHEIESELVEWFGSHEARHTFATWLDHAGLSEARADRYMGHSLSSAQAFTNVARPSVRDDARREGA